MESRIKSYIKKKDKNKPKEKESYKLLRVTQNLKQKKEKDKNKEMEKDKKEETFKVKRNLKYNKSMAGILSDSETIKTETTRGDTLTENNKNRYIYRKSVNKKNFSFAIKNFFSKNPETSCEKKNRLNYSMSLNKFIKSANNNYNSNENILSTNHNFYRKQSNLMDNYRTNQVDYDNVNRSLNLYSDKSHKFYERANNISCLYERNEEFINIEDLLLLEDKFNDVLISVKSKHNTPNECFELLNAYQQSSLYNNFENYFRDLTSKTIVHAAIMYLIYNVIICYHFSFDVPFFNTCYQYLESVLEINHKSYLLLCDLISLKISSSSMDNIWVDKLRQMIKDNLRHIELNNKEYTSFFLQHDNINYKNQSSSNLLEIKFYSIQIEKCIQLFLNSLNNNIPLKRDFCTLFENIDSISADKLLHFFKSKIIRVINQNASVAGIESSSYKILLNENSMQLPYLKNKCPKKFSLVLDLDETLISFKLEPNDENKGTIRFRPYLDSFLQKVKEKYEIIVFTSGTQDYADPLEDAIEQDEKYFDARLYRQHTIACGKDIVKDISRIGRPLDKILIVENMPQNYRLQKENGILIKSFYGEDIYDTALVSLGDILMKIANEFNDVRKGIAKYKNEILNKVSSNLSKKKKSEK
jgi:Dullard-like phosphatase family protein